MQSDVQMLDPRGEQGAQREQGPQGEHVAQGEHGAQGEQGAQSEFIKRLKKALAVKPTEKGGMARAIKYASLLENRHLPRTGMQGRLLSVGHGRPPLVLRPPHGRTQG